MGLLRSLIRRGLFRWYRPRHWSWRPNTVDARIFRHVVIENEYRLPARFSPTDVILDVGGHIGSFTLAALRRGAQHITVCEPDPENLVLLRRNLQPYGQRVDILSAAVWGGPLPEGGLRLGNPLDSRNTGANRVGEEGRTVPGVAFDALVDRIVPEGRIRLVKLDCEGAEWPILTTSQRLDRIDAFCGEYHLGDFAPPGSSTDVLQDILGQAGFRVEIVPDRRSEYPLGLFFAAR